MRVCSMNLISHEVNTTVTRKQKVKEVTKENQVLRQNILEEYSALRRVQTDFVDNSKTNLTVPVDNTKVSCQDKFFSSDIPIQQVTPENNSEMILEQLLSYHTGIEVEEQSELSVTYKLSVPRASCGTSIEYRLQISFGFINGNKSQRYLCGAKINPDFPIDDIIQVGLEKGQWVWVVHFIVLETTNRLLNFVNT